MRIYLPIVLGLCLLWGCNQSVDPEQADVEPLSVQGELIDSAPADETKSAASDPDPSGGAPEIVSVPGQAAQASEIGDISPPTTEAGGALQDALGAAVVAAASGVESTSSTNKDEGEYKFVAFDTLAGFEYFLTPMNESSLNKEPPKDQIPKHIRDLNGKKVIIEGYMVPIDVEGERIQSFILTNSMMMCCYGAMPWINEWIFVEMENEEGAGFYNDTVIRTKGILEVGEEIEDGMVISLYRMKADVVESTGEPIPFLFGN